MKKKPLIIGIHGLANKPEPGLLSGWWRAAIMEGLERNGYPRRRLPFRLCYWATHIYGSPKDSSVQDPEDPRFLAEPYVHSLGIRRSTGRGRLRRKALDVLEKVMDWALVSSVDPLRRYSFEDLLIKKRFPDLDLYYNDRNVRGRIQDALYMLLQQHADRRVLLIAHSMGSIVAYDVLSAHPELDVEVLVTIGSPLAVPSVLKRAHTRIPSSEGDIRAIVPESVRREWWNLADLQDRIAMNYTIRDECNPNSRGVLPVDCTVDNDYSFRGAANPHKSYGYLRCATMARIIEEFLKCEKRGFWQWLLSGLKRLLHRRNR